MHAQHLYYDILNHVFLREHEALLVIRSELHAGNLHAMTDRLIEYSFPPDERAEVMKIIVRVERPGSLAKSQERVSYFHRPSRRFISHSHVRELLIKAAQKDNLDLMTDRTHEYGFIPGVGCLKETQIVKISVIVNASS